jgi:hypothetical protein
VAAAARTAAHRIAAGICWASAGYLLLRVIFYYFQTAGTRRHHVEAASLVFLAALVVQVLTSDRMADEDDASERPAPSFYTRILAAFVAGALVLYWPVLITGLFADDFVLVDAARAGRFTVWRELFRPAIFVVWRAALALRDDPAILLHAVNVALHGANAFLVFAFARATGLRRPLAICAGALFLTFPAAVEAVSWPSGLQDVLMTTCVLAVLVSTLMVRTPVFRFAMVTVFFIAGLTAKETAIAAPVLLAALGLIPGIRQRAWTMAAWCTVLTVTFLVVRFSLLPLPTTYSPGTSRYAIKELLVRPFATLIVPFRLDETSRHPALGIVSAVAVVLVLTVAASKSGWRDRTPARVLAGALFVLGSVAPVLAYFYVDPDLLGSRYVYLAVAGWALLLSSGAAAFGPRQTPAIGFLLCVMALWVPATRSHIALWQRAADLRGQILAAAVAAADRSCAGWVVTGVPPTLDGVPLFVNGFPEAARPTLGEPVHLAPATPVGGQCRLAWTGTGFSRD